MTDKLKTIIVTGANSGIGYETAHALLHMNCRVLIVCRNPDKAKTAVASWLDHQPDAPVETFVADLSLMSDVKRVSEEILAKHPKIDALINNAGLYLAERTLTTEGNEVTWAVNQLAPLYLNHLFKDALGSKGRIVTVSSWGHHFGTIDFDNLQGEKKYAAMNAYGRAKLASIMTTYHQARLFDGVGPAVNCLHPGAIGSNFAADGGGALGSLMKVGKVFLTSPRKGADTSIWLATAREAEGISGKYLIKRKLKKSSKESYDEEKQKKLYEVSCQQIGINNS